LYQMIFNMESIIIPMSFLKIQYIIHDEESISA